MRRGSILPQTKKAQKTLDNPSWPINCGKLWCNNTLNVISAFVCSIKSNSQAICIHIRSSKLVQNQLQIGKFSTEGLRLDQK